MSPTRPTTCLAFALLLAARPAWQRADIVGTWRGTSTCVDRAYFPGCADERAIYEIRPHAHAGDSVIVRAEKLVRGERELVSEDVFGRRPDGSWSVDLVTPRYRVRISLRPSGDGLTGTLIDLSTARQVRAISLRRVGDGGGRD